MQPSNDECLWDLSPAISLLNALSFSKDVNARPHETDFSTNDDASDAVQLTSVEHTSYISANAQDVQLTTSTLEHKESSLGDFGKIWDFLGKSRALQGPRTTAVLSTVSEYDNIAFELESGSVSKFVRWRDELDGADLEDDVEVPPKDKVGSLRTQKRAARRARAKERAEKLASTAVESTGTDAESGEELERLRQSPERKAIIQETLKRDRPVSGDGTSPPTSPSPPESDIKRVWPMSSAFRWQVTSSASPSHQSRVAPIDSLSSESRKKHLITLLARDHPEEAKYLANTSLADPTFTPLNVSNHGIHVFIDISNIMIGFHDCLKMARNMPLSTRVRRVPMCFHNFSLVLERGRPAAKRVLVGSDKFPVIQQAKEIGYETNILERVHKAKEVTPRQKKFQDGSGNSGLSSGSETATAAGPEKWVEQAVDEILHLKILESLIDAAKPSTMVLATGDAAEAEYSGGFMRMVERALEKGWMVELVSFKLNTSGAYKRKEFRSKWGLKFKWMQLDSYVEHLIDSED